MRKLLIVLCLASATFVAGSDDAPAASSYCRADCASGSAQPYVDCYATNCSAHDAYCPSANGSVVCDGVTYSCGTCPAPECSNGQVMYEPTGTCCCNYDTYPPRKYEQLRKYVCVSGTWQYHSLDCGSGQYCSSGGACPL